MTNYYELEEEVLSEQGFNETINVIYKNEFDSKGKLSEIKDSPEKWVILIDPDIDKTTLIDKETYLLYDLSYKGYELIEFEQALIRGIEIKYEYLSSYLVSHV